jgi:hypothetical protein
MATNRPTGIQTIRQHADGTRSIYVRRSREWAAWRIVNQRRIEAFARTEQAALAALADKLK